MRCLPTTSVFALVVLLAGSHAAATGTGGSETRFPTKPIRFPR